MISRPNGISPHQIFNKIPLTKRTRIIGIVNLEKSQKIPRVTRPRFYLKVMPLSKDAARSRCATFNVPTGPPRFEHVQHISVLSGFLLRRRIVRCASKCFKFVLFPQSQTLKQNEGLRWLNVYVPEGLHVLPVRSDSFVEMNAVEKTTSCSYTYTDLSV